MRKDEQAKTTSRTGRPPPACGVGLPPERRQGQPRLHLGDQGGTLQETFVIVYCYADMLLTLIPSILS